MTTTLKRIAELIDGDEWALADLLADEFPEEQYGGADRKGGNTGLHAELERYSQALERDYGIDRSSKWLAKMRATSVAWPSGERSPLATFDAHALMRGADRQERMTRYLRANKGRPLSTRRARSLIAEERPQRPLPPWEEQVDRRVNATAKALVLGEGRKSDRADWWHAREATSKRRQVVASALRRMARLLSE